MPMSAAMYSRAEACLLAAVGGPGLVPPPPSGPVWSAHPTHSGPVWSTHPTPSGPDQADGQTAERTVRWRNPPRGWSRDQLAPPPPPPSVRVSHLPEDLRPAPGPPPRSIRGPSTTCRAPPQVFHTRPGVRRPRAGETPLRPPRRLRPSSFHAAFLLYVSLTRP